MPAVQAAILAASRLDSNLKNKQESRTMTIESSKFGRIKKILTSQNLKTLDSHQNVKELPEIKLDNSLSLKVRNEYEQNKSIEDLKITQDLILDIEEKIWQGSTAKKDKAQCEFSTKLDFENGTLGDINKENSMEDLTAQSCRTLSNMNFFNKFESTSSFGKSAADNLVKMDVKGLSQGKHKKFKQLDFSGDSFLKNGFNKKYQEPLSPGEDSFSSFGSWSTKIDSKL